jgi:hypothetical protein
VCWPCGGRYLLLDGASALLDTGVDLAALLATLPPAKRVGARGAL